jgi:23S rRNA pseudouridine1911/1915/1917 synthase
MSTSKRELRPAGDRPSISPPRKEAGQAPQPLRQLLIEAGPADDGTRLDRLLVGRAPDLSRSRLQALIKTGWVRGGSGTIVDPGTRVKQGERYVLDIPPPEPAEPRPEAIPLAVVYEDEHLIVIDKPAGTVVHPAAGHASGTLVNALIAHCGESLSGIGGVRRPGIVHRLDKDTSGLLVVAKTDAAHRGLAAQFAAHGADGRLQRRYLALAWGGLKRARTTIDAPLARSRSNRTKIGVSSEPAARHAVTHLEILEQFGKRGQDTVCSLVECRLETGRTHQIRVHLAHIGHPLLGDRTYGAHFAASARRLPPRAAAALNAMDRQALHAAVLDFVHPVTGRRLCFESPPPSDFARLLDVLRAELPAA